jgi:hypothetical protein
MNLSRRLLLVGTSLLFSLSWAAAQDAADSRPAVFVRLDKTTSDELPSSKRKELTDSVHDLEEQIEKRPGIRLTKKREDADVVVTVLDRRIEMNTTGQTDYGGSYTQKQYQSRYILTFRIDAAGHRIQSDAALAGAFVTWKRVAATVAKDVEIWVNSYSSDSADSDRH